MRRSIIILLVVTAAPRFAAAQNNQSTATSPVQPGAIEYLSRFDFAVAMDHLFTDDPRFVWDARFGGDLDMVDYGYGRATFKAEYQTILGNQFREFDPNQGNYMLEGSLSARTSAVELAGVYHHVSRHLSDRPKRNAVDWNMIGARVIGRGVRGRTVLGGRFDIRGVVWHSFVDYRWDLDGDGHAQFELTPRTAAIVSGAARIVGVDGSRDRGTQYGLRGEGGVRFYGRSAAIDLLAAAERRIDPYQLEFSTMTWLTLGFRISSR